MHRACFYRVISNCFAELGSFLLENFSFLLGDAMTGLLNYRCSPQTLTNHENMIFLQLQGPAVCVVSKSLLIYAHIETYASVERNKWR